MTLSGKQLAAYRRNALKGGVKTEKGKAFTRLNALKHSLLSQEVLLEGESHEAPTKPARAMFNQVWLKDKTVVAVKPRPELEPFYRLNYEEFLGQRDIEGEVPGNHEASVFALGPIQNI